MSHALYVIKLTLKSCYAKAHFLLLGMLGGFFVHPTAVVDLSARLGKGVYIGPYAVIGADVTIGAATQVGPHAVIQDRSEIGAGCTIASHAIIGDRPYDYNYQGEPTRVRLEDHVKVMEFAIVQRATGANNETVVGSNSMIMSHAIVGHNSKLGEHVQVARDTVLAGHVTVDDHVFIGIRCTVIQERHIGRLAYIGANTQVLRDVPPFALCYGPVARIQGVSHELAQYGFQEEQIQAIEVLFHHLWFTDLPLEEAMGTVPNPENPFSVELSRFIRGSRHGLCKTGLTSFAEATQNTLPDFDPPTDDLGF